MLSFGRPCPILDLRRLQPARTRARNDSDPKIGMRRRNALIADEVQQTGTVDHTPVYPREVVKRALELSATAIVLVHNHPTWGEAIPPDHVQCH